MALIIPCSTTRVVSIAEYLDHVRSKVDLRDVDSLAASAPMLRALANDRSLVAAEINRRVENYLTNAPEASALSLLLGSSSDFYVRANIWPAIADMVNGRTYQDQLGYNLAHDHNFSFMTVTYLGPGYETELYEYDYEKVEGYVGEPVDLRYIAKVRFAPGSVMLYRANSDAHVQFAPEELTITLNLMVSLPESDKRDQFYFDLSTQTISGYPNEQRASLRASFLRLAGHVGDGNTRQLLSDVATQHPCRRTRLTAFEAICRLSPAEASAVWAKAASDATPLVANTARRKLHELERS